MTGQVMLGGKDYLGHRATAQWRQEGDLGLDRGARALGQRGELLHVDDQALALFLRAPETGKVAVRQQRARIADDAPDAAVQRLVGEQSRAVALVEVGVVWRQQAYARGCRRLLQAGQVVGVQPGGALVQAHLDELLG